MGTKQLSQDELEAPAKVYQLEAVRTEIENIRPMLETILKNTDGVVTTKTMEQYVDKRIEEKTKHLVDHKVSTTRVGWAILMLIIGDIAQRLFNVMNGN